MQWDDRTRRRLKLRDLDVLLAVIETGSMGKAAEVLRMSQPAISKSIASLEHVLSVRLLDRSRQGVEPTPFGRAVVKRGLAVFDELRQGVQDITFLSDPSAGETRLGGSEQVGSAIFAPIIEDLTRRYSRMSFHVASGDLRYLLQELDARRIDIIVSRIAAPLDAEHSAEVLFDDPIVVIAAPSHPLARRRKVRADELTQHAWTLQPADNHFGRLALERFRIQGLTPPKMTVESTSSALRSKLLDSAHFLSMTPRFSVLLPRPDRGVKILSVDLPPLTHPVAIITLKDRLLNPAAQLFVEHVRRLTKPLASRPA